MAIRDDFIPFIDHAPAQLELLKSGWRLKLGGGARVTIESPSLAELLTVAECCEAEVIAQHAILKEAGVLSATTRDSFTVEDEGRRFELAKSSLREQFADAWSRYERALLDFEQSPERTGLAFVFLASLPELWRIDRSAVGAWLRSPEHAVELGPQLLTGGPNAGALATLEPEGALFGSRASELAGTGDDSLTAVLELARTAREKLVGVRNAPNHHA